jgi:hypothetical protein
MQLKTDHFSPYLHTFSKKAQITKPLKPDHAKMLIGSPYFYELVYNGVQKFFKTDGSKYDVNEFLKLDDEFEAHQPELELSQRNRFKVLELEIDSDHKTITTRLIKPSTVAPFQDQVMKVSYYPEIDGGATIELTFGCSHYDATAINIIKSVFDLVSKRLQRLADNPEQTVKDFSLVATMNFNFTDKSTFYGLSYALSGQLIINQALDRVKSAINTVGFIEKALPDVVKVGSKDSRLQLKDNITIKLTNMRLNKSFIMESFQEDIELSVQGNEDDLVLISKIGVTNFHQLGFRFKLAVLDDKRTVVTVHFCYSRSNLIAAANYIAGFARMFTTKSPDMMLFMHLRARNIIGACLWRLCPSIEKQLGEDISFELSRTDQQPIQKVSAITPNFS